MGDVLRLDVNCYDETGGSFLGTSRTQTWLDLSSLNGEYLKEKTIKPDGQQSKYSYGDVLGSLIRYGKLTQDDINTLAGLSDGEAKKYIIALAKLIISGMNPGKAKALAYAVAKDETISLEDINGSFDDKNNLLVNGSKLKELSDAYNKDSVQFGRKMVDAFVELRKLVSGDSVNIGAIEQNAAYKKYKDDDDETLQKLTQNNRAAIEAAKKKAEEAKREAEKKEKFSSEVGNATININNNGTITITVNGQVYTLDEVERYLANDPNLRSQFGEKVLDYILANPSQANTIAQNEVLGQCLLAALQGKKQELYTYQDSNNTPQAVVVQRNNDGTYQIVLPKNVSAKVEKDKSGKLVIVIKGSNNKQENKPLVPVFNQYGAVFWVDKDKSGGFNAEDIVIYSNGERFEVWQVKSPLLQVVDTDGNGQVSDEEWKSFESTVSRYANAFGISFDEALNRYLTANKFVEVDLDAVERVNERTAGIFTQDRIAQLQDTGKNNQERIQLIQEWTGFNSPLVEWVVNSIDDWQKVTPDQLAKKFADCMERGRLGDKKKPGDLTPFPPDTIYTVDNIENYYHGRPVGRVGGYVNPEREQRTYNKFLNALQTGNYEDAFHLALSLLTERNRALMQLFDKLCKSGKKDDLEVAVRLARRLNPPDQYIDILATVAHTLANKKVGMVRDAYQLLEQIPRGVNIQMQTGENGTQRTYTLIEFKALLAYTAGDTGTLEAIAQDPNNTNIERGMAYYYLAELSEGSNYEGKFNSLAQAYVLVANEESPDAGALRRECVREMEEINRQLWANSHSSDGRRVTNKELENLRVRLDRRRRALTSTNQPKIAFLESNNKSKGGSKDATIAIVFSGDNDEPKEGTVGKGDDGFEYTYNNGQWRKGKKWEVASGGAPPHFTTGGGRN